MTSPGAAPPAPDQAGRYIRSHDFRAPLPDDVRAALRNAVGHRAPEVWDEICAEVGIEPHLELLPIGDVLRLATAIAVRPGALGLAGRSLLVRTETFRGLARQDAAASAPPWDWARTSMTTLLRARLPSPERTAELASLDLFSPPVRKKLDRVARRAAGAVGMPIGLVGVVLEGAQPFIGIHGLTGWPAAAGGVPIEWSFCATIVRTAAPYVIPDTAADVIQRTNPLAVHDGARSYVGVPLVSTSGQVLGSVCALGGEPQEFGDEDLAALSALAAEAVTELEAARSPAGPARLESAMP